jgi:hypothetical protein
MAHLGGLRMLATGIYMSIIPAQQAPTSHPTCTHTLPSFRPFTPKLFPAFGVVNFGISRKVQLNHRRH